jgi:hypothetical protein
VAYPPVAQPHNGQDVHPQTDAAARLEFESAWLQLAPLIDEARGYQALANHDPSRFGDPWVEAHTRWLSIFDRELSAARTVHEALEGGAKLSADDIAAAAHSARRLLESLQEGRQRAEQLVPQHV